MRTISLPLIILILSTFIACQSNPDQTKGRSIVVSILPQKYIIDRLSDSTIKVTVVVPPGSSPELYEPTALTMKEVSSSELLMIIGPLEFEKILVSKIVELAPSIKILNHSDSINLIEGECGHLAHQGEEHSLDPHIWSSPKEFRQMVSQTYFALTSYYPEKTDIIKKNLKEIMIDIDRIDSLFSVMSTNAINKKFIVYHPAYGYLAHDYGFEQLSIEENGKTPSAEKLRDLVDLAKLNGISKVFVQAQFDAHFIESLALEINADIVQVDPLAYDWVASNLQLIDNFNAVMIKNK